MSSIVPVIIFMVHFSSLPVYFAAIGEWNRDTPFWPWGVLTIAYSIVMTPLTMALLRLLWRVSVWGVTGSWK